MKYLYRVILTILLYPVFIVAIPVAIMTNGKDLLTNVDNWYVFSWFFDKGGLK